MSLEIEQKRRFLFLLARARMCAFAQTIEPKLGSGIGFPDALVLVCSILYPIEFKGGEVRQNVLFCKRIRPTQIAWHDDFKKAGGKSFVFVCEGQPKLMDVYSAPSVGRECLSSWESGWPIANCRKIVEKGFLIEDAFLNELQKL